MFRFKLRTLLIVTALVAVPFALQVHVHNRAQSFAEEMRQSQVPSGFVEYASVLPLSFTDVCRLQRRCKVHYIFFEEVGSKKTFRFGRMDIHLVKFLGNTTLTQSEFEIGTMID